MDLALARDLVFARYQREEGTLNWTDIDFWSRELELDIPALKEGIRHLIEVHPDTEDFLEFLRQQRETGGPGDQRPLQDPEPQDEPHGAVGLFRRGGFFLRPGHAPRKTVRFWEILHDRLRFDPSQALLVDDNAEALAAARTFGIKYPYFKAKSSSRQERRIPPGLSLHRELP